MEKITLTRILPTLKKLIKTPSVSGNEHEISRYVKEVLAKHGFQTEEVPTPNCGPTLLASYSFNHEGSNLLFYGHLDTVKPVEGWKYSPFKPTIIGGLLYGLGSSDMKGGVSALITAAEGLVKMKLSGSLTIALTSDEELYSRGCDSLIKLGKLKKIDVAISAEPTGLNRMEIGRTGRVVYDLRFQGVSTHASIHKPKANALVDASKLVLSLNRFPVRKGNVTVLAIEGGTEFLSVPDSCRLVLDRQLGLGETVNTALNQVETLVKSLNLKSKVRIKLFKRPTPYMKPYMVNKKHRIVEVLEKTCLKVRGVKPKKVMGPSVGDENYLVVRAKIPTVTIGPKGGNEHAANEYVDLNSVVEAANIYLNAATLFLNCKA